MIELSVTNAKNETLMLTGDEGKYQVINIEGLNPPETVVNLSTIVGMDGAKLNSLRGDTRNIVITLKINGDVEQNRLALYQYFPVKKTITLHFTTDSRSVDIEGVIDTFNCDLFTNSETAQISVICPYPFFKAVADDVFELSGLTKLFKFPFAISSPIPMSEVAEQTAFEIVNQSSLETGIKAYILFNGTVEKVEITNNDQTMTVNYSFIANDELRIDTVRGEKSIKLTRAGTETNILSAMVGDFIQIVPGMNNVAFSFDDGESTSHISEAYFSFRKLYEAI